jgi:hypothetical protein
MRMASVWHRSSCIAEGKIHDSASLRVRQTKSRVPRCAAASPHTQRAKGKAIRRGANGPCTERQPLCDAACFGVYIQFTTSKGSGEIGAPGESCQALTRRAWATVSSNSSRTSPRQHGEASTKHLEPTGVVRRICTGVVARCKPSLGCWCQSLLFAMTVDCVYVIWQG